MKKLILASAVMLGMTWAAQAGIHISFGLSIPVPPIPVAVVGGTHCPPRPVCVAPPPVVCAPRRVVAYAAPPVVIVPPPHCYPPPGFKVRRVHGPYGYCGHNHHHHRYCR